MITLQDCLDEVNNALNFWYPCKHNGAEQNERDARHVRLFGFRDKLQKQINAKADRIDEGDSAKSLVVKSGPAPFDQEDVCFDCGLEITGAAYPAGNFCELCEPCWVLRNATRSDEAIKPNCEAGFVDGGAS